MSERELVLLTIIKLLEEHSYCLYSVLSEFDGDKTCYLEYNRAEIFREAIEALRHKV